MLAAFVFVMARVWYFSTFKFISHLVSHFTWGFSDFVGVEVCLSRFGFSGRGGFGLRAAAPGVLSCCLGHPRGPGRGSGSGRNHEALLKWHGQARPFPLNHDLLSPVSKKMSYPPAGWATDAEALNSQKGTLVGVLCPRSWRIPTADITGVGVEGESQRG